MNSCLVSTFIVNKVGNYNLNYGESNCDMCRQNVSNTTELSQALTQVHNVTRTYTVVNLTLDPLREEMVSVVDEVTPPIRNCYCLQKHHDDRYPDKYLRAKRGLSMTEANPRRWFYSCSKPRWVLTSIPLFFHFLFPSNNKFVCVY
jgi:hypothetical protein